MMVLMLKRHAALAGAILAVLLTSACDAGKASPLTPQQIPGAFVAVTGKPDRTVHLEMSGSTSVAGGGAQPFTATFDLAGDDYAGSLTSGAGNFGKPGGDVTIELARVSGQGYERGSGETMWQQLPTTPSAIDPLRDLAASDVEYVGQETRDGQNAHHLRIHNFEALAGGLVAGTFLGGTDGFGETFDQASSTFDVWTDATGQPTEAALDVKPGAVVFDGFAMTATYRFSNWNAEIYIVPPHDLLSVDGKP